MSFAINSDIYLILLLASQICITTISSLVLAAYSGYGPFPETLVNILNLIANFSLVWHVLIQLTFTRVFSHYVLIVQKIVLDMVPLGIIAFLICAPFWSPFSHVINDLPSQTCQEGFHNPIEITYSLFKAFFNTFSFEDFYISDRIGFIFIHMVYVVMGCLLILNMIIAVFTDSVSFISGHKDMFLSLQVLAYSERNAEFLGYLPFFKKQMTRKMPKIYKVINEHIFLECTYIMSEN